MAEIVLNQVKKSYGKTDVIHGIDWQIHDGEFVVIVGPSGCGKSTLLRMIAGLEVITDGEISISGKVVNNLEPADRNIAMVFQNYALYPHMSVYKNMAYGLKIRGIEKEEIDKRVKRAAEILEIGDFLERSPRQLSGGQRQRVAMGRAIVREPSVFLFDEPLSNLDAKLRVQMRLEIKNLQEQLGITSVYVTHDQVEAMTLGHRLMVLNGGHVEQLGSPIELYEKPATKFVAGFIGSPSMNFMQASIDKKDMQIRFPGGTTLPLTDEQNTADGGDVTVGIRPEHMVLVSESEADLSLIVRVVEQLGADTLVHGLIEGESNELTVRLGGVQSFSRDQRISVKVKPEHVHLFDNESGKRI